MNPNNSNQKQIHLSDGTALEPFVVKLLGQRGVIGQEAVCAFLEPKLNDLPSPFLMKGMETAVEIVEKALLNKHSILIWGDYDVDGTTATSLLLKFFKLLGFDADYYIPNRLTEGYGLQEDALKRISEKNKVKEKVLITVDNGISAHKAVVMATKLGYRTIITDHHTPPSAAVLADAILNPKQDVCSFPSKNLAGVGVAFYLAMGIRSHLSKKDFFSKSQLTTPNLKLLLDLVAVGTVADMVPLHGINRILVRAGVETMSRCGNEGLTALCRACSLDPKFIRSEDISFQIAPKINAAGRLGDANKAVQLFLSKTKKEGQAIARDLVKNNELRKIQNISDFDKAVHEVECSDGRCDYSTIVSGAYHVGVAGIVASNLVESYKRPSVVLCKSSNEVYRGSVRSVPGVDIYKVLESCKEFLLGFGGHKMAGGLSLNEENINNFKELFDRAVFEQNHGHFLDATVPVDADMEIDKLFVNSTLRQLHLFEPFGQGNPQLIFRDTMPSFQEITPIGKDKSHLRLGFGANAKQVTKGIAFGFGGLAESCRTEKDKEILYTPSVNFFRGKRSWQVRVTDIVFPSAQHAEIT